MYRESNGEKKLNKKLKIKKKGKEKRGNVLNPITPRRRRPRRAQIIAFEYRKKKKRFF